MGWSNILTGSLKIAGAAAATYATGGAAAPAGAALAVDGAKDIVENGAEDTKNALAQANTSTGEKQRDIGEVLFAEMDKSNA